MLGCRRCRMKEAPALKGQGRGKKKKRPNTVPASPQQVQCPESLAHHSDPETPLRYVKTADTKMKRGEDNRAVAGDFGAGREQALGHHPGRYKTAIPSPPVSIGPGCFFKMKGPVADAQSSPSTLGTRTPRATSRSRVLWSRGRWFLGRTDTLRL